MALRNLYDRCEWFYDLVVCSTCGPINRQLLDGNWDILPIFVRYMTVGRGNWVYSY